MKKIFLLILIFTILALAPGFGETVEKIDKQFEFADLFSFESPVMKSDAEKKWFFSLSAGYTEMKGNTETLNTSFGGSLSYDDDIAEFKIGYAGSYGKLKGVVNDNKGTATMNFDYYLFWRLEFFSYTMSEYNKITLLTHRNGSGLGMKIFFIRNGYLRVDLSGAPILQYEDFEEQPVEKQWRWSVRGRVQIFPVKDKFSIKYYIFYIPVIENINEYRTIQEITAEIKLYEKISLKTGYYREYNTYNKKSFEKNPLLKKTDSTVYIQAGLNL